MSCRRPVGMPAIMVASAFALLVFLAARTGAPAAETDGWQPVFIARFGNIDAIDAPDGDLAAFVRTVRNDGGFPPPLRTLIGPEIRNPTFFGLAYEAWMENLVLVPSRPGPLASLWIFPVDNRDEYMAQLAGQGLSEYEGMDRVTVLREVDRDGVVNTWHLEWLPGNVAVFGRDRSAVSAARMLYAENRASRGLLANAEGGFIEPDITVRLHPSRLAGWQDSEPGSYWLRETIRRLTADLVTYWSTGSARTRLVNSLSADLASWPRRMPQVQASVWFERHSIEWKLDAAMEQTLELPRSNLEAMRRLPEKTALAYAFSCTRRSLDDLAALAGRLLLGAAGGVTTTEARETAASIYALVSAASPRQAAAAWINPPAGRPDLGAARLFVAEWASPEHLRTAWETLRLALEPNTPASHAFAQMGLSARLEQDPRFPGTASFTLRPAASPDAPPYLRASYAARLSGPWLTVVGGKTNEDKGREEEAMEYRIRMAQETVANRSDGAASVRDAFTRMGAGGASFMTLFDPVLFCQMALLETADWRPRSPDQPDPLSAQLTREMLEYDSGGAWSATGESRPGGWSVSGGMSWDSLSRLSAALGITEAIGIRE